MSLRHWRHIVVDNFTTIKSGATAGSHYVMQQNRDTCVVVNKTVGAASFVDLPASPVNGQICIIKDGKGDAGANNVTVTPTPSSGTIEGSSTYVISANFGTAWFLWAGDEWKVIAVTP